VSSEDGLDEMSTAGRTQVVEVTGAGDGGPPVLERYTVTAAELGLAPARTQELAGGTPADNAHITRRILAGERGPQRDIAVLNAGAAIYVSGRTDTLEAGVRAAEEAVDDGSAAAALDRFVACTQRLATE
jgi:anthranilate phosphoribosyltransferase